MILLSPYGKQVKYLTPITCLVVGFFFLSNSIIGFFSHLWLNSQDYILIPLCGSRASITLPINKKNPDIQDTKRHICHITTSRLEQLSTIHCPLTFSICRDTASYSSDLTKNYFIKTSQLKYNIHGPPYRLYHDDN